MTLILFRPQWVNQAAKCKRYEVFTFRFQSNSCCRVLFKLRSLFSINSYTIHFLVYKYPQGSPANFHIMYITLHEKHVDQTRFLAPWEYIQHTAHPCLIQYYVYCWVYTWILCCKQSGEYGLYWSQIFCYVTIEWKRFALTNDLHYMQNNEIPRRPMVTCVDSIYMEQSIRTGPVLSQLFCNLSTASWYAITHRQWVFGRGNKGGGK